ncbi:MAG: hydroxyacid-oxoacid transhydrogenase [Candidatus Methylomirabilales bacterium]
MDVPTETIIPMETVPIKFGVGATEELPFELKRLGVKRVLLVTDRRLVEIGLAARVRLIIEGGGVAVSVYDGVHVEPTDRSLAEAVAVAGDAQPDAFVALGGGSAIDTAKGMNLFTVHPAPLATYLNKPIGEGRPIPGPLKPLVAIPTTAGTGSESTPVLVLDLLDLKVKTGVSHRYLRPTLALIDPMNTVTMPPEVTAASGCDVLCHAIESFTCKPYDVRPRPPSPAERPGYIGANPISDLWSEKAIELAGKYLRRAVLNGHDLEARTSMLLASTYAGIGFGNAGVHLPHAMGYPVAGMVRDYLPPGYAVKEPLVPHGISCIVNAPAAFRFTAPACPERQARAAHLLGARIEGMPLVDAAMELPGALIALMRDVGVPNGLRALGYSEADVPALTEGALKQQRLLDGSPRTVGSVEMQRVFREAMQYW